MEPNPHPAQVPPAARSLQVHDKRRLGSTLSSNHILRHRKTCLSFPKTYFELPQTVFVSKNHLSRQLKPWHEKRSL